MRFWIALLCVLTCSVAYADPPGVGSILAPRDTRDADAIEQTRQALLSLGRAEEAAQLQEVLQLVQARLDEAKSRLERGDAAGSRRSLAIARAYVVVAERRLGRLREEAHLRQMRNEIEQLQPPSTQTVQP